MQKLDLQTANFTDENIEKLAVMFPHCVTEERDEQGQLKKAIDFDLLKQELSANIVDGQQERYQINWPGKRQALITANTPINKTLRPCREESVDFDSTQNLYIEGDNLDALKILQETYLGKVKMIYIDPPYNTGKDFIYKDDFKKMKDEYLEESGQKDEDGGRLVANPETNGRYHSDWLSMMYPRLKLARNLLEDDGVIFISIDDNEVHNLRKVCDEVFGVENFLVNFAWKTDGNFDNQAKFKKCHEYILGYAKQENLFMPPSVIDPNVPSTSKLYKTEVKNTIVKNGSKNPISKINLPIGFPSDLVEGSIAKRDDVWPHYLGVANFKDGKLLNSVEIESGWSSKELLQSFISNNCQPILDNKEQNTRFVISRTGTIEVIKKRSEQQSHVISFLQNLGGPQRASSEIKSIEVVFDDYPKPLALVKYLCQMVQIEEGTDIILDFFSGSATTAHAVMQLNAEDASTGSAQVGNRKFIMVQLPEETDEKSEAYKAGYKTIAEIGKERIRRAGKKIKEDHADKTGIENLDIGFRVLKIDSSNMNDVYYSPNELTQASLQFAEQNIKADRTAEDLLFQVLLDWGVDLSLPIVKEEIEGKAVYFVGDNAHGDYELAACFDDGVDEGLVKALAGREVMRVVFKDTGFAKDEIKDNVEQIFKQLSPETEVRAI